MNKEMNFLQNIYLGFFYILKLNQNTPFCNSYLSNDPRKFTNIHIHHDIPSVGYMNKVIYFPLRNSIFWLSESKRVAEMRL